MIRLSDLDDKMILAASGKKLGRVHDVSAKDGQVQWLEYGSRSLLERLRGKGKTSRISWSDVREVSRDAIVVDVSEDEPRARPGTRRPSGRRSAR